MIRRILLAALIGVAPIGLAAADTDPLSASIEQVESGQHTAWTEILSVYVRQSSDGLNRFDYGALKDNAEDRAKLTAYVASFADLDFDRLSRDAQFAAWANLYNALTIQHIIERYPLKSIRDGYFVGPWKEVKTIADGREVSLDAIEHDILRVQWDDPRVHYAVNCASVGCPNLGTKAWLADTLNEDLDIAARAYVNDPRGVTIRPNGTLKVSRIYKWFREDFGGNNEGVIDHLLTYASDDLAAQIRAKPRITKHAYDWSLNDTEETNS